MTSWVLALLMAAASQAAPPSSGSSQYITRAWDTNDGLPQNSVTSIVQTRDGYLWLGTFGGLVRFDGNSFTVFTPDNSPGLSSSRIVSLHEDQRGVLWIGTEGGLTTLENGRFNSDFLRGARLGTVWAVLRDRRGRVWIGSDSGLTRFEDGNVTTIPYGGGMQALVEAPDGTIWGGTHSGIVRFRDGAAPVKFPAVGAVRSLVVDREGTLWVGAGRLYRWLDERLVEITLPGISEPDEIPALAEDASGNLWIGKAGKLFVLRDGVVHPFAAEDAPLSSHQFRSARVDAEGNLWIGTDDGGINRIKQRRLRSYLRPGQHQSIGPIVGDGAGGLWIGATCGGLLHFDGTFRTFVTYPEMGCVWALHRDPDGAVWMGTAGWGLRRFANGRLTTWGMKDGLQSETILGVARDRHGLLWIGSWEGVSSWDGTRFTHYRQQNGLTHDVRCIMQDRSGAMWFGGVSGLSRFENGRFTRYTTAQGLSHDHVRAIHEDADGVLWIGTYGGGLNRLKDGKFTTIGIKEGLPDAAVSRIMEDARGNFWMSGNTGVYRVGRSQLNDFADGRISYITAVSYGTADGMVINETNGGQPAGWQTPDGTLWFPTIKGLVGIDPITEAASPPRLVVERAVVNREVLEAATLPPLGPGHTDAEFHFTAIDLGSAEKTRFRYRLDPYDREWIDSGARRVAYYTQIPPGRYRFEVMGTDSDGNWTAAPAQVAVVVVPFWWQRVEVLAAAAIFLLIAVAAGVRSVSLRRARARLAELERERSLDRERTRIARDLHDDLGARLSHIAMLADASAAADPDARIAGAARDAVQTMDELVWAVNARNDTIENFAYYVAQYAEEHVVAAGLRCRLDLPADLPAHPLEADVRRHLYLAVKEALNNALKHAGASEIRLSLRVDPAALVVEVSDNGRGLPADIGSTGNGLKNFRERMDACGGTLEVASEAGHGTRLTFTVPLRSPGAHGHAPVHGAGNVAKLGTE